MSKSVMIRAHHVCNIAISGGVATMLQASADSKNPLVRRFKLTAYTGGKCAMPDWPIPVAFDLSSMTLAQGMPIPALFNHDNTMEVGHTEAVKITPTEITGVAITSADTIWRNRVVNSAVDGFEWQLSVGVFVPETEKNLIEVPEGVVQRINGQDLTGPFLLARHAELREITFISTGADLGGATATLMASWQSKNQTGLTKMTFAQYLKSINVEAKAVSSEILNAHRILWRSAHKDGVDDVVPETQPTQPPTVPTSPPTLATSPPTAPTSAPSGPQLSAREQNELDAERRISDIDSTLARLASEGVEISPITDPSSGVQTTIRASAITNRWSGDQLELHVRRQRRPGPVTPGRAGVKGSNAVILASLQGALLSHMNMPLDHRGFFAREAGTVLKASAQLRAGLNATERQQWMDQSHKWSNYSLLDLMEAAAQLDGVDLRSKGHYTSDEYMQAAFSTTSISDMYTQSVNAKVMQAWSETESKLMVLVSETDVPNFLQNERVRIEAGGSTLKKLINQGVAREMTMSSTGEVYRASMFATRFSFSEMDAINQRFSVLEDAGNEMGKGSRNLIWDLIALVLIANPTMSNGRPLYNTTDGNYAATQPINAANVESHITSYRLTKERGRSLNLQPTHCLTGIVKDIPMRRLFSSAPLIAGGDTLGGTVTSKNMLEGLIPNDGFISDARIDNGFDDPTDSSDTPAFITGLPNSHWLFDKNNKPFELGYVLGHGRAPRIRKGELSNGQYGFWQDCSMAVGCAPIRRMATSRRDP
jgi:hypothetical protein